jgi:hypothetical protein
MLTGGVPHELLCDVLLASDVWLGRERRTTTPSTGPLVYPTGPFVLEIEHPIPELALSPFS